MAGEFDGFGRGMERGMALAQHAEGLVQQREQLEETKKLNVIKVGDAIMESYNSAATLKDAKARQMAFDEARHKSTILGKPVSDSVHAMLTSDSYRTEMLQATASMLGLPDAKKAEQYGSIGQILGGDPKLVANVFMQMRDSMAREAQAKAQSGPDMLKMADDIRRERSGLAVTKNTAEIATAYEKIQNVMKEPSPAGDLSLIFAYMKMLDPGSTVREGEQASAQNTAGVPDRVRGIYNRIVAGERLVPEQRQDFFKQARGLYAAQSTRQQKVDQTYSELARTRGIDPKQIFISYGGQDELDQQTLAARERTQGRTQVGQAPAQAPEAKKPVDGIALDAARRKLYTAYGIDPADPQAEQRLNREIIRKHRPDYAKKIELPPEKSARAGGRK
jgi:hypothetical protein